MLSECQLRWHTIAMNCCTQTSTIYPHGDIHMCSCSPYTQVRKVWKAQHTHTFTKPLTRNSLEIQRRLKSFALKVHEQGVDIKTLAVGHTDTHNEVSMSRGDRAFTRSGTGPGSARASSSTLAWMWRCQTSLDREIMWSCWIAAPGAHMHTHMCLYVHRH